MKVAGMDVDRLVPVRIVTDSTPEYQDTGHE